VAVSCGMKDGLPYWGVAADRACGVCWRRLHALSALWL